MPGYGTTPYGVGPYGDPATTPSAPPWPDNGRRAPKLTFRVANSLTGRLTGRLNPGNWSFVDPLTGQANGTLSLPLPTDSARVEVLARITQPHVCQIVAHDEHGRYWFGGPILSDPARDLENELTISFSDWRAWFYAAPIRPVGATRTDYLRTAAGGNAVEQCTAIADLATLGLATVGKPHLVVTAPPSSGVMRDVTARMFKTTGAAMDNVARRDGGPDWWTDLISDPADERNVIARLNVGWPERAKAVHPLKLRYVLGENGNLTALTWPRTAPPPSRVFGVGGTAPDEVYAEAVHPDLTDGERLAWDEVWQLPEGVATRAAAFEHSYARLAAHGQVLGAVEVEIVPDATDLGAWGPGDRARLRVKDGWRDLDLSSVRVLSRTLSGRGEHVTGVTATLNLSESELDIDEPTEEA